MPSRFDIFQLITDERLRQDEIDPKWNGNEQGLAILMEEVGKVAKSLNELHATMSMQMSSEHFFAQREAIEDALMDELIHVAAVCVRWYEKLI